MIEKNNRNMKTRFLTLFYISFTSLLISCGGTKESTQEKETEAETEVQEEIVAAAPEGIMEKNGLKLIPLDDSPSFPDAQLAINSPSNGEKLEPGTIQFDYTVTNYELGVQTSDADTKTCANSGKGQHIHLILNNEPYTAHYESSFSRNLEAGHYVALSFISRSYHESIKNSNAFVVNQFTVGDAEGEADLSAQHLFYSRPKGEYKGEDTKQVMLDFYLVNTSISADGNKVKATVNGNTEFMINNWQPYLIEGLPMGENTIKLELVDNAGNLVEGGFNSVERIFTLTPLQ